MKTIYILFALLFATFTTTFAQSVNNVALKDLDVEYIRISEYPRFAKEPGIQLDYGQEGQMFDTKSTKIVDAEGKLMGFNSIIHALNFLDGYGYEFVDAYAFGSDGDTVPTYLLRKKRTKI